MRRMILTMLLTSIGVGLVFVAGGIGVEVCTSAGGSPSLEAPSGYDSASQPSALEMTDHAFAEVESSISEVADEAEAMAEAER